MIAIDWGTSSFRAYRLEAGQVTAQTTAAPGILAIAPGAFPATLRAAIAPWLEAGERRILMSGMVGSRQGWIEAPYLPCPATPAALAAAAIPVPFEGADLRLVPGLSATDPTGTPEVMRGEETQIVGLLDHIGPAALICLPGTHSKWAAVRNGGIDSFTTHLTGEAFAALRAHTILGRLMAAEDTPTDPAAFHDGAARARQPGGLLHHLFGVRTLGLFGHLAPEAAASYLSGLLISHEITAVLPAGAPATPIHLTGAAPLCALYAAALEAHGAHPVTHTDAAAPGLWRLSEHIAWT